MFKNFFNKLNAHKHSAEMIPEVLSNTATYDELYNSINQAGEIANSDKTEKVKSSISIPERVEITELENILHIEGTSKELQIISDEIQSMEFLTPGDHYLFGDWRFLVTDGSVMSSKEEKFIALPPDEWLMMGCKFNDAISGYDLNPYTFFCSPFGSYKLPYGIEIFVTDLHEEEED